MGRSHFSFDGERKVCKRKPAARRLREKALYYPFCRRGSQCRAQFSWIANTNVRTRSCARLFPPSKWAGLFPFAAYRRSAPPRLAWGKLKWRCLGCFDVVGVVSQHRKTGLIFPVRLALGRLNQRCLGCFAAAWIFLQHKRPAWVFIHAGLCCEPEGLSPDGGLFYTTDGK